MSAGNFAESAQMTAAGTGGGFMRPGARACKGERMAVVGGKVSLTCGAAHGAPVGRCLICTPTDGKPASLCGMAAHGAPVAMPGPGVEGFAVSGGSHGRSPPSGTCCTTTRLLRTSAFAPSQLPQQQGESGVTHIVHLEHARVHFSPVGNLRRDRVELRRVFVEGPALHLQDAVDAEKVQVRLREGGALQHH